MTDQTQAPAENGQQTTDAAAQQTAPGNATTTALTDGGNKQTEAEATALTGDAKAKEGEGKTEPKGEETKSEADKAKSVVPEKYEFKAPEGVSLDETMLGPLSEVAKDIGLTQEQAQKLIDKMAPALNARTVESVRAAQADWKVQQVKDTEFGGEQYAANLGLARKAMDAFATDELRQLLDQTGLGDHPEVIRVFYRAGKAISEDSFVSARTGKPAQDPAAVMFPSMTNSA